MRMLCNVYTGVTRCGPEDARNVSLRHPGLQDADCHANPCSADHVCCLQARLPRSEAKVRLATVEAARAVAACLTPGMPPVEHVSILPRGDYMARIIYQPQVRVVPNAVTT